MGKFIIEIASKGHLDRRSVVNSTRRRGTLFNADTTTYAQDLRDECDFVGRFDFYTQFAWTEAGMKV